MSVLWFVLAFICGAVLGWFCHQPESQPRDAKGHFIRGKESAGLFDSTVVTGHHKETKLHSPVDPVDSMDPHI